MILSAQSNSVSFDVFSNSYASGQTLTLAASTVSTTTFALPIPSVSSTIIVAPLNFGVTLDAASAGAITTRSQVTATVKLTVPQSVPSGAPLTFRFGIQIPNATSATYQPYLAAFPQGVVSTLGSNTFILLPGSAVLSAGASTASNTFTVDPTMLGNNVTLAGAQVIAYAVVPAGLGDIIKSTSLGSLTGPVPAVPAKISTIAVTNPTGRPSTTSVRSGGQVKVVVTYTGGQVLDGGPTFTISAGAFSLGTPTVAYNSTTGITTYTYLSRPVLRLSRNQDVSVTATDPASGSSASGTITVLR